MCTYNIYICVFTYVYIYIYIYIYLFIYVYNIYIYIIYIYIYIYDRDGLDLLGGGGARRGFSRLCVDRFVVRLVDHGLFGL